MLEDPRTIAAIIALLGVFLSVTSSVLVTRLTAKTEREKIKQQLHNTYAEKIISKRMESYPILFDLISTFVKQVYDGTFKESGRVKKLSEAVRRWDGQHAIFMSSQTQRDMYLFRKEIDSFCTSFEDTSGEYELTELEDLWKALVRLELSLKTDIGVFVLDKYDGKETFSDYGALMDHMKVR